jgi:hypothetical protein
MIYLIYVSSATKLMRKESLLELMEQARSKNQRLGVSGMLLYKTGNFMQRLEGEREMVLNLYETILKDPRHRDVFQVHTAEIEERNFPEWSMGFTDMDGCEGLPALRDYLVESLLDRRFHEDSEFAYQFMVTFNEINS